MASTPTILRNRRKLGLHALEQRTLPAQLIVTSSADDGSAGTFRSVLAIANTNNEADTVTFDAGVSIINLKSGQVSLTTDPNNLTIIGPGVTINGGPTATTTNRILRINVSAGNPTITISGLTFANGNLGNVQNGGAIQVYDETLVLDGVAFINNKASGRGGAITSESSIATQLTLTNCTFTNNQASSNGGAINADNTITINVDNCVFTGNAALSPGGGIHTGQSATITVNTSTFSKNTSNAGAAIRGTRTTLLTATNSVFGDNTVTGAGGAMEFTGFAGTKVEINRCTFSGNVSGGIAGAFSVAAGACTITESTLANNSGVGGGALQFGSTKVDISNSTISGNTSTGKTSTTGGGAILFAGAPNATIQNTTIVNNSSPNATTKGGGIFINSKTGTITLNSVILAGNSNPNQRDLSASGLRSVAGDNNLIGAVNPAIIMLTGTNSPALIGTETTPIDPQVLPLANNGGNTETHLLKTSSPAIDAGNNGAGLIHDQRGVGFPRRLGPEADIGAVELTPVVPWANASTAEVSPGSSPVIVTVVYEDDVAIDTATIDLGDIRMSGPGFALPAAPTAVEFVGSGKAVTATYSFDAPLGGWNWFHNGSYQVVMQPNQVFDFDGPHAVESLSIGLFDVKLPLPELMVDSWGDAVDGDYSAGQLTLREAIGLANFNLGMADSISFSGAMAGKTIAIGSPLTIVDSLQITGLGPNQLAISGGGVKRIFEIDILDASGAVTISSLTLTRGYAADNRGGAVSIIDENVTLHNVHLVNNLATGSGGAIGVAGKATLTIGNSTLRANTATVHGGGLFTAGAATVTINNSWFDGNLAGSRGGGIRNEAPGQWTITASQLTNNYADIGGALESNRGAFLIRDSAIHDNVAADSGGGMEFTIVQVTIESSTFADNRATSGGGLVVRISSVATINNSTISGNLVKESGGGVFLYNSIMTINNSTIASNSITRETGIGAGLYRHINGTLTLNSTIVADNVITGIGGSDVETSSGVNIAGDNNLVEYPRGQFLKLTGVNIIGVDPRLTMLTDNGGPTRTHALFPGSPAFEQGSNALGSQFDQRGLGFARQVGAAVDIGAVEGISSIPNSFATVVDVNAVDSKYEVVVEFNDDDGIDINSIDIGDVTLTGGLSGNVLTPTMVTATPSGTKVTATYHFTPPGGGWDFTDNGQYTLTLKANQVFATGGVQSVSGQVLGTMRVTIIPPELLVDQPGDVIDNEFGPGQLSLREAIYIANSTPGTTETISFAPNMNGQTIDLQLQMLVTDSLIINGPGAGLLTISGGSKTRIFDVNVAGPGGVFQLSNLTLANGQLTNQNGGAIRTTDETVTLDHMVLANNRVQSDSYGAGLYVGGGIVNISDSQFANNIASLAGGAIRVAGAATITINRSVFDGNEAAGGGAISSASAIKLHVADSVLTHNLAGGGGAISVLHNSANVTVQRSTFADNGATTSSGGGLSQPFGVLTISDSSFHNNSASVDGGAINVTTATVVITNTTLSDNLAKGTGSSGGAGISVTTGSVTFNNSTVTGNSANGTGGGIRKTSLTGSLILNSTIVAANSAASAPDIGFTPTTTLNIGGGNNLIGVADGNFKLTGPNQTGTAQAPLDPLLAPLADNGGPTKTHAVLAGSLAINRGSNPLNLEFDQRGVGYPRQAGTAIDIGATEHPLPPVVSTIVIADGSAQRSMIRSITITLSEAVEFPLGPAAAFQLQRTGPGGPIGVVTFAALQNGRTVMLTFADPVFAPAPDMSLIDGNYTLTLVAPNIQGAYATLDGNGDGIAGDSYVSQFHRLFGDSDGDRLVSAVDFNAFRLAYGGASLAFDFNNDGIITALDFQEFRMRYGIMI